MKYCLECDALIEEGDEGPALYECGSCGMLFNCDDSGSGGRQCPGCHKFASKVADESCPECGIGELARIDDVERDEEVACEDCGGLASTGCDKCGAPLCEDCATAQGGLCSTCEYEQEKDEEE